MMVATIILIILSLIIISILACFNSNLASTIGFFEKCYISYKYWDFLKKYGKWKYAIIILAIGIIGIIVEKVEIYKEIIINKVIGFKYKKILNIVDDLGMCDVNDITEFAKMSSKVIYKGIDVFTKSGDITVLKLKDPETSSVTTYYRSKYGIGKNLESSIEISLD